MDDRYETSDDVAKMRNEPTAPHLATHVTSGAQKAVNSPFSVSVRAKKRVRDTRTTDGCHHGAAPHDDDDPTRESDRTHRWATCTKDCQR